MTEENIKELKYWINDTFKTMNQSRHEFCKNNEINDEDYYPYLSGYLKTMIKHLIEIVEKGD